ncbi:glucokinase [Abditibacteriota bacterium]|nr:glucokinase [Abditibacteriota bacterium]
MSSFLVVDVGGTKILAAALDREGRILARLKLKTDRSSKESLLTQLEGALDTVLGEAKLLKSEIGGIALGVPGVVDSARGHVVLTPNAPLSDTPLREILSRKWSCPIVVGNDVNVGMAGEVWRGAAQGASSAFGIFVGTGIGGGLVLNGQVVEGFRGLCGEIGHLLVPLGVELETGATAKKQLYLEEVCSRTAIENQIRFALSKGQKSMLTEVVGDKKLERIRSGALKEALKKNDPLVTEVVRRASYLLGLATASVIHIVDPEVVVFGGGVIEACGKWMMPQIEKAVQKVAMQGTGIPPKIVQSTLGDDAILFGGLSLLLTSPPAPAPLEQLTIFAAVDKPVGK